MDLIADLEARNLIHDSTDREFLRAQVADGQVAIYYGCDPTADSLHVGNLIGLITLRRFQDAGHRPIALAGGATGMVGDPSGRSEERNLLDDDTLDHNVACIKEQLAPDRRPGDRRIGTEPWRTRRQPRLDATDHDPGVPPRRRQARHGQPDARP